MEMSLVQVRAIPSLYLTKSLNIVAERLGRFFGWPDRLRVG
jgi:hypothetical protein